MTGSRNFPGISWRAPRRWSSSLALAVGAVLFLSIPVAGFSELPGRTTVHVTVSPLDPMVVGECFLRNAGSGADAEMVSRFQPSGNLRLSFSFPGVPLPQSAVYPVALSDPDDFGKTVRVLFRMPKAHWEAMQARKLPETVEITLERPADGKRKITGRGVPVIGAGGLEFSTLYEKWREMFLGVLESDIRSHEDHELELLLFLRWGGRLPTASFSSWTNDRVAQLIWDFCGVNDVRGALPPASPRSLPDLSKPAKGIPLPLQLPSVEVPPTELGDDTSFSASFVPADCYYLEWPTWEDFRKSRDFFADLGQKWAPDFYSTPLGTIFDRYLAKLGCTEKYVRENLDPHSGPVVIAGRDPFFAAGTGVLMLIGSGKGLLPVPPGNQKSRIFHSGSRQVLMLSNDQNLFNDSLKARGGGSLRSLRAFRYTRKRLSEVPPGNRERFFLYLSDPWFANILGPRWMIQNLRLNRTDSRIRLAELLKLVWMRERGLGFPPSLSQVRADPLLPGDWADWLLADLEDGPRGVRSRTSGGLEDHFPIDSLPFDGVTEEEAGYYEKFRSDYLGRWRKMDPVGLQLLEVPDEKRWVSRLYVSPVAWTSLFSSNQFLSPFRSLHDPIQKEGQLAGISFSHGGSPSDPDLNFIRFFVFDAAPTTFPPEYWLERRWTEDQISLLRTPVAVSLTHPGFIAMARMFLFGGVRPSMFKGIDEYPPRAADPAFITFWGAKLGRNLGEAFALDLSTIKRLVASGTEARVAGVAPPPVHEQPTDVRAYMDFDSGPMFRRFLLHLAVQDRGIESWRRDNRLRRIGRLLGLPLPDGLENLGRNHVFPSMPIVHKGLLEQIPRERGEFGNPDFVGNLSYTSPYSESLKNLPDQLLRLRRLDFFISREENALLFETHAAFSETAPETRALSEKTPASR